MRKLVKLTLLFVAISVLFPSCVSKKKFTDLLSSKETVDATLAQTQEKVKTLEGENEELMSTNSDLESKNASLSSELSSANTKLNGATADLNAAKSSLTKAQADLDAAEKGIKGLFSSYEGTGLNVVTRDNRLYIVMEEPVMFRSGSTRVARKYHDHIKGLAEVLKNNPNLQIQVEGHTDNAKFIDGAGNNWSLSMSRAMNAVNMLIRHGANPNQLSAVGRGEYAPVADMDPNSKEARAQNRRVEFVITPNLSSVAAEGTTP